MFLPKTSVFVLTLSDRAFFSLSAYQNGLFSRKMPFCWISRLYWILCLLSPLLPKYFCSCCYCYLYWKYFRLNCWGFCIFSFLFCIIPAVVGELVVVLLLLLRVSIFDIFLFIAWKSASELELCFRGALLTLLLLHNFFVIVEMWFTVLCARWLHFLCNFMVEGRRHSGACCNSLSWIPSKHFFSTW